MQHYNTKMQYHDTLQEVQDVLRDGKEILKEVLAAAKANVANANQERAAIMDVPQKEETVARSKAHHYCAQAQLYAAKAYLLQAGNAVAGKQRRRNIGLAFEAVAQASSDVRWAKRYLLGPEEAAEEAAEAGE